MNKNNPDRTNSFYAVIALMGHGGHSSVPHKAHNPILAANELIRIVAGKVWFEFDSFDNVTFFPVDFTAGTKANVIPDNAFIKYYGEYVTEEQYVHLKQVLENALKAVGEACHVAYKVSYDEKTVSFPCSISMASC